jgi:homogentisate phytyltransferase/homogentisate geranylgeranyltransferase
LKRYPFRAAFSILVVRGIIVNLGLYLYYASDGDGIISVPNHIWALTLFFVLFGIAIALLKDIPDTKGDRVFKINTFALRIGSQAIFNISLLILFSAYLTLIGTALFFLNNLNTGLLILSHCILILILWSRQRKVNAEIKSSIMSFYMFVWKLFFIEYIIFPIFFWLNPTF